MEYPGSLHNHSDFSNIRIRDSINKIPELVEYANELGHKAIATTEHEFTGNWLKFQEAVQKVKEKNPDFKGILGNEIYLVRNGLNKDNFKTGIDRYYHFILLAKDREGAKQIQEISTKAWMRSYMGKGMRRVPTYYQDLQEIISNNKGHVIGSTACLGSAIDTQLLKYRDSKDENLMNKIENWILKLDDIFGHRDFYFELQPSHNKDQIYVNQKLIELSKKFDIKYIITTDSHYLKKEDRKIHKAFLNSQNGEREVDEFYSSTYMMDTKELESYFTYLNEKEIQLAYKNIEEIINKCEEYDLRKPLKIPELKWNNYNLYKSENYYNKYKSYIPELEKFYNSNNKADKELVWAIINGIEKHKDLQNEEAYDELNSNLEITWKSSEVNKAHWSAYFLNLQHIIDVCWDAGTIVGCGRGSGVGFLLLYVLDITQINPLREKTKCYPWRFLNPDRVSPLDVDFDISGIKRSIVLNAFRKEYGEDRVANVATFGTEQSKSAIQTACRGLGFDVELGLYISSLIPSDRGLTRTLSQCYYGDEEKDFKPIKQFVDEMNKNPQLWEVAQKIEGLINRSGIHAGGIIFVDEPFTNFAALMRAPDGTICTQYELHDSEKVSMIKYDALSVEAMDKIQTCIDLLCDYGYLKRKETLKETYESAVGIYNLERNDPKMWDMVWNHKISSLFQMEQQSGIQGIKLIKPKSVDELATLNSVIRLMAQEKGGETPLEMWAKYRKNINLWYDEMRQYGLSEEEIQWLANYPDITDGIAESQESLMKLVQESKLGGNDLMFADTARKALAKKIGKLFDECEKQFFKNAKEKHCSERLVHYVWDILLRVQRGYSFNKSHTLAYSLIALQEMNLAYKFPIIFWNTACLITDAGGNESEDIEQEEWQEEINYGDEDPFDDSDGDDEVDIYEEEDEDYEYIDSQDRKTKTKKKIVKTTNYGKVAIAIGKMKMSGINVSTPDINDSSYTFTPDVKNNVIRYGLRGITRIGEEYIKNILDNRPYLSLNDFLNRIKTKKTQAISLIKAGCFDKIENKSRQEIMKNYIDSISDKKKRLTLQNMQMLITKHLLPSELEYQIKVYNFNKYLKKNKFGEDYYKLDEKARNFYEKNYDVDVLENIDGEIYIKQKTWDKFYKKDMEAVKVYIAAHPELLNNLNQILYQEVWDKYALGSISKWEMDSLSFYNSPHELSNISNIYNINNFFELPENPIIDKIFTKNDKSIVLYKLNIIAGTVIDKNKAKHTATLLTTDGVVNVKFYKTQFAKYDKQISERDETGKKKIVEKSWFTRGNKLMIVGIRRDDFFIPKIYAKSMYDSAIMFIDDINENGIVTSKSFREDE